MKGERCYQGGQKHKFEGRYEEIENKNFRVTEARNCPSEGLRRLMIMKEYIKDVCIWCGKTIERNE